MGRINKGGNMISIELIGLNSDEKWYPSDMLKKPFGKDKGGIATFFGIVRGRNHGRDVVSVTYDVHKPVAKKVLTEIAMEAKGKFGPDLETRVVHFFGKLLVGEMSVGIAVASKHRDEAFLACRYIIEQLKTRVPIWKKEIYRDGETEWLKGHELCSHGQSNSEFNRQIQLESIT